MASSSSEVRHYNYEVPPSSPLYEPLQRFNMKHGFERQLGFYQRSLLHRNGYFTPEKKDFSMYYERL